MVTAESLMAGRGKMRAQVKELEDNVARLEADLALARGLLAAHQWQLDTIEDRTRELLGAVGKQCRLCGEPIETVEEAAMWDDPLEPLSGMTLHHADCVREQQWWHDMNAAGR